MAELTQEDVDAAGAKYLSLQDQVRQLKDSGHGTKTLADYKAAKEQFAEVRARHRQQEEAAGRRIGLVSTD